MSKEIETVETTPMPRRGFLRGLLALAPAAALATAAAPPAAAAATPQRENWKLLRLGEHLAEIEEAFAAAVVRKAEARRIADRLWPAPPAGLLFDRNADAPLWCSTQVETDIDDKVVSHYGGLRGPRHAVDPFQLQTYVDCADRRTREAKQAVKLLALAQAYEQERQAVIERSGYGAAKGDVFDLAWRIDRIFHLIRKCRCHSMEGLAIKARAVLAAMSVRAYDDCTGFRAQLIGSELLARDILALPPDAISPARFGATS